MNFISNNNTYEFDSIDWKNDIIALYIQEQYVCIRWEGSIFFFIDHDDLFGKYTTYNHRLTFTIIHELCDDNLVLLGYDEDYVVEHIARQMYLFEERKND